MKPSLRVGLRKTVSLNGQQSCSVLQLVGNSAILQKPDNVLLCDLIKGSVVERSWKHVRTRVLYFTLSRYIVQEIKHAHGPSHYAFILCL
jgi:hypothetical protein